MAALPQDVQAVAALGYAIVPATSNKVPMIPWRRWITERQTPEEQADLPRGDLYAVVTGDLYNLVVLDFDGPAVQDQAVPRKLAPNVVTGSGGWHVWLYCPTWPVKTVAAVRPSVDVRGEGGLAYFYGTSAKGTYRLQATFKQSPADLLDLLPEKLAPTGTAPAAEWEGTGHGSAAALRVLTTAVLRLSSAQEGERNTAMCREAYKVGGLVGSGTLDVEAAFAALVAAAEQCGAEGAARVIGYQMEAGMAAPWSADPVPDENGLLWVPASDPAVQTNGHRALAPADWTEARLPLPLDAFPEAVARLTEAAAPSLSCPPGYLAMACLPALAAGIGGTATWAVTNTWTVTPSLYVALVGDPGTAKSPALAVALAPLESAEAKAWKSADDGKPPRLKADDATVEALSQLLAANPRGLVLTPDELAAFFGGMGAYKAMSNRDRQFYLSAWSGSAISVDRVKGNTYYVERPCLSIVGGIQPAVFDSLTEGADDGLLPRFLLVYGEPLPKTWGQGDVSTDILDGYARLWNRVRGDNMLGRQLTWGPGAEATWARWYNRHHASNVPEGLVELKTKTEAQVARVALVLACCDSADAIGAEHIERAVEIVRFSLSETAFVYRNAVAVEPGTKRWLKNRGKLADWIEATRVKNGKLPTRTEAMQRAPFAARRKSVLDPMLDELGLVLA
jgi:uncharacterized protein DUF3987